MTKRVDFPLPVPHERVPCKKCRAPMVWIAHVNKQGRTSRIPLDYRTAEQQPDGTWRCESHFATCLFAEDFRRGGKP